MADINYRFAKLEHSDLPMVRGWLEMPHMQAHWGDPVTEYNLIDEDIDNPVIDMWIVSADQPFAFVQDYPAHHWPMPQYARFPRGTRGIDTFIGASSHLNHGHCARYLNQHARALLNQGYPAVVIDPSPQNTFAVKAYRKAGFAGTTITPCEDGDPVLVLEFKGHSQ